MFLLNKCWPKITWTTQTHISTRSFYVFRKLFVNKVNCFEMLYTVHVCVVYDWKLVVFIFWKYLFVSLFHFCLLNSSNRLLLLTHCPWAEEIWISWMYIICVCIWLLCCCYATTASQKPPFFIRHTSCVHLSSSIRNIYKYVILFFLLLGSHFNWSVCKRCTASMATYESPNNIRTTNPNERQWLTWFFVNRSNKGKQGVPGMHLMRSRPTYISISFGLCHYTHHHWK